MLREFAQSGDAIRARFEQERAYQGQPDVEIVVLTARSEDEIRATHRRYFQSAQSMAEMAR